MFIVRPQLTPEEAESVLQEISNVIQTKGEITKVDKWGKRPFAYEIEHLNEGYYFVVNFKVPADFVSEVDRKLRLNDNVLRHLIIRTDEN